MRKATMDQVEKRVLIYIRKSPNGWDDEGCSPEMQEERCRAYCVAHGLKVAGVVVDLFKRSDTLKRPGLQTALDRIAAREADGLVVYRLDRLSRSQMDLLWLFKQGPFSPGKALFFSLNDHVDTSTANGRLMLNFLVSVLEWQREYIGETTKHTLDTKRAAGCYIGGIAYGWRRAEGPDGKLTGKELVPAEQAVVARIRRMMRDGVRQPVIAERLNAEGIAAPKGKRWTRRSVQRVLEQPELPEVQQVSLAA